MTTSPVATQAAQQGSYFAHLPSPLLLPSPEEVYDAIMAPIEPELTVAQVPLLDGKYRGESPDEAQARRDRYQRAFASYEEGFRAWRREIEQKARAYQRTVVATTEERARTGEAATMSNIEHQFLS
ncbi:MAG: hypothetical protein G01um101425_180 [Candidatus Peregrinibacteria bacterium Gr01-1014_25]|nr:MAG: hypothetical protein G01um101425_180 [Candidatus Peregrinibacteria bacterium Gr01-1014_25]